MKELPRVMLCLLTKNDAVHLPSFLNTLDKLDYPHDKLRWVWIYGHSVDNTLELILDFHRKRDFVFEIYKEPIFHRPLNNALYIARLCNEFKKLYKGEDFVWFLDTDIEEMPSNTLKELIKADKDIIAPYVYVRTPDGDVFYDTYVFRFRGWKFEYVVYNGKTYSALDPIFKDATEPVELDSVGTCVLIKAKVFLDVDWEDPAPHLQFCKNARKKGYKVWALPRVKIYHKNVVGTDAPHYSLEWYVKRGMLPESELEKVGYKKVNDVWLLDVREEDK